MSENKRQLFEVPKVLGLDGKEVTEDRLVEELTADQVCLGGGKTCTGGGSAVALSETPDIF